MIIYFFWSGLISGIGDSSNH